MKYSEYQELAMRTASPISRATNDNLLMQAAMGLCGEIGEFIAACDNILIGPNRDKTKNVEHALKELGDVMWYAITGMQALGITGDDLDSGYLCDIDGDPDIGLLVIHYRSLANNMAKNAGILIDMVKKQTFHGEGHEVDKAAAAVAIGNIIWPVKVLAHKLGSSLDDVMEKNIQKLRERYPEGFDADLSAHRKEGDV